MCVSTETDFCKFGAISVVSAFMVSRFVIKCVSVLNMYVWQLCMCVKYVNVEYL